MKLSNFTNKSLHAFLYEDERLYLNGNVFHMDMFRQSAVNICFKFKFVGVYLILVFLIGLLSNATLLWIFYGKRELRNKLNSFVIALTVNNLLGCILELPFIIKSSLSCRYLFHSNLNHYFIRILIL